MSLPVQERKYCSSAALRFHCCKTSGSVPPILSAGRKFVQITGSSCEEDILRTKPEKARELLAATDMSVTEIAFRYGFSSSQYFATVFKRLCCSTPTRYRRMMKKMPDAFGH